MNTEITDENGKKPTGWIFYDAECGFCVHGVKRWSKIFASRGFRWLPLQTPGTAARLGVSESALRDEMKLLCVDGRVAGGVDAWALLFRSVWWLSPVGMLLKLPGAHWFGANIYRWIARNRYCFAGRCELHRHEMDHKRHAAFFEMP